MFHLIQQIVCETNLNSFKFLKKKYKLEIGWSDHSVDELLIYKIYKDYNIFGTSF